VIYFHFAPHEVITRTQRYLQEYPHSHAVILVGDAGTGKTNIIYSFTKEKIPNNIMPTVALEYTSKVVELDDKRRVKAQIWDTAGQEQYRALTMKYSRTYPRHYQKAVGAFIVFDVANRRSFEHVSEWVSALVDKADSSVQMGLLGHKSDHLRREVSHEEAEAVAKKLNCFYV
jgi:small GTP-binding protein